MYWRQQRLHAFIHYFAIIITIVVITITITIAITITITIASAGAIAIASAAIIVIFCQHTISIIAAAHEPNQPIGLSVPYNTIDGQIDR